MSGPKRNADSINTIGIVVVGICGAVMVYVSITALQAFYMNDSSQLQTMQDYGGQDTVAQEQRTNQMLNVNGPPDPKRPTKIDTAIAQVVNSADEARKNNKPATLLVPGACEANMPTEVPQPGRPVLDTTRVGGCKGGKAPPPPPAPPAGAGSGSNAGAGSGATAPATGTGSGAGVNIHLHSTGGNAPGDTHGVAGTGGAPVGSPNGSNSGSAAKLAPGGHAP